MGNSTFSGFVIAAGALLGVCAGLLWTAQGSLMLAYATEATKGRYIATFWIIFNLGEHGFDPIRDLIYLRLSYHIDTRRNVGFQQVQFWVKQWPWAGRITIQRLSTL
jgi:hypothetical protein